MRTERFNNRAAQGATSIFGLLVVLVGLSGFGVGSPGLGAFSPILGLAILGRGLWSSSVEVGLAEVITRSMISTRRYSFEDLIGVEVRVGTTGLNGFGREHLVFHCTNGGERAFADLNCRPSEGTTSVVRSAATCIEERLSRR